MNKIIINGGIPLFGEVKVSGSKNAALPLIFASLLTNGKTVFYNVPDIGDVRVAIDIVSDLGARIEFANNRLAIDTSTVTYKPPNPALVSKIRASTYLIGASLARFGIAEVGEFGGCNFDFRPIDFHIKAAMSLGAKMYKGNLVTDGLKGSKIYLEKPSVGATVNSLIMSAAADGVTEIYGFAKEPHILSLIDYLSKIGLSINISEEKITIKKAPINPIEYTIIGDMVEASSYIIAGLITNGEIIVSGFETYELNSFFNVLYAMGYAVEIGKNYVAVGRLKQIPKTESVTITAIPHPGFPTDIQPLMAPLLAINNGGQIIDTVWSNRFGYLKSLSNFGIIYSEFPGGANINKSTLSCAIAKSTDLRGGMSCIIAALSARGKSEIFSPELVLRGYDSLSEKLNALGADVKLINI